MQANIYNIALEKIRKEIVKHELSNQSVELTLEGILDIAKKVETYKASCRELDRVTGEVNKSFASLSYLRTIETEKRKDKDQAEFAITSL